MSHRFKLKLECLSDKKSNEIFLISNCNSSPLTKFGT